MSLLLPSSSSETTTYKTYKYINIIKTTFEDTFVCLFNNLQSTVTLTCALRPVPTVLVALQLYRPAWALVTDLNTRLEPEITMPGEAPATTWRPWGGEISPC